MSSVKIRHTNPDYFDKVKKNIKFLEEHNTVAVGFPKSKHKLKSPHYDNGESILNVAIKNNYGIGVPRRDFLTPTKKKWHAWIQQTMERVGTDLLEGKIDALKFMTTLGLQGQKIMQKEIIDLDTPPNAPSTIEAKGSSNPLVDTGDMVKHVTFEIRKE